MVAFLTSGKCEWQVASTQTEFCHSTLALATAARPRYAVSTCFNPNSTIMSSRILNFWILPVTVCGNDSTKRT
jgi:hypothetical protein